MYWLFFIILECVPAGIAAWGVHSPVVCADSAYGVCDLWFPGTDWGSGY